MEYKNYIKGILKAILLICVFNFNVDARIINISVSDMQFSPSSVNNAQIGDTIRWTKIGGSHTTTSGIIPGSAAAWNHDFSLQGVTFDYTLTAVGTYNYFCNIHGAGLMSGTITVAAPTGIVNRIKSFNFYPNPFQKYLILNLKNYSNTVNVEVYDILGKQYFSNKFIDIKDNKILIDTDDFNPGIYFIYITTNGKKEVFRIMKNSVTGA